jgi:hypothetical protein
VSYLILSQIQVLPLLKLRNSLPTTVESSTDLGLSKTPFTLAQEGLLLPDSDCLPWPCLEEIAAHPNSCFTWDGEKLGKVTIFSGLSERLYSLYPTIGAPSMLVSGIPMHRIKGTTPERDTREKLKAAGSPHGTALDTSTGLGYTAIAAARTASRVLTIELDPAVLQLARLNPWSAQLFENPRIEQRLGDSSQVLEQLGDGVFSWIMHDPPMLSLAGDLYGLEFYRQLFRVLRPGGRLFHYIGDPDSFSGARVTRGVVERLAQAGFRDIQRRPRAFGVTAIK